MKCILCEGNLVHFTRWRDKEYLNCLNCESILLNRKNYVSTEEEKTRYKKHDNDVDNKGYQNFVSPIVNEVLIDYKEEGQGLDFGSGTGPVITKLLRDEGYNIKTYDPFFANHKERLKEKYDYIVCCEVMEHFHNPSQEFRKLRNMLKPGGRLYLMTEIYDEEISFELWNYKNDETHVFFYHKKALEYIKKEYDFDEMIIKESMIIYKTL